MPGRCASTASKSSPTGLGSSFSGMFAISCTPSRAPFGSASRGANSAAKSSGAGPVVATSSNVLRKCVIRAEVADQDLGDLASRNHVIAGIAGLACIALQEDKPVRVRTVVVEPAGRTIVYGSPLARTSRSERRFQSWASVVRL